jgi:hypothetical protein
LFTPIADVKPFNFKNETETRKLESRGEITFKGKVLDDEELRTVSPHNQSLEVRCPKQHIQDIALNGLVGVTPLLLDTDEKALLIRKPQTEELR